MIRLGQTATHNAAMANIAKGSVESQRISTDMRVTTEEFVNRQQELNAKLEKKCRELTQDIGARFIELRQELGTVSMPPKPMRARSATCSPVLRARRRR